MIISFVFYNIRSLFSINLIRIIIRNVFCLSFRSISFLLSLSLFSSLSNNTRGRDRSMYRLFICISGNTLPLPLSLILVHNFSEFLQLSNIHTHRQRTSPCNSQFKRKKKKRKSVTTPCGIPRSYKFLSVARN